MKKHANCVGIEKRKFSRLNDPILISTNDHSVREFKALTRNISEGGLMFETTKAIQRDTLLKMEIYQPICSCKSIIFSIPALIRVLRSELRKKDHFEKGENRYIIGGEFLEIKDEDRQRIAKYIKEGAADR